MFSGRPAPSPYAAPSATVGVRASGDSGAVAVLLVVILSLLVILSLAVGLAASMALRHGVRESDREVADRLAELGAMEGYVVVTGGVTPPAQPGHVCVFSSPCTPSSPGYLGCYTYRSSSPYSPGDGCGSPGPVVYGSSGRVWALGVSAGGSASQVVVEIEGRKLVGWSVVRR